MKDAHTNTQTDKQTDRQITMMTIPLLGSEPKSKTYYCLKDEKTKQAPYSPKK